MDAKKPSLSAASTSFERRTALAIASLLICSSWLRCVVGLKMTLCAHKGVDSLENLHGGVGRYTGHSSLCALVYRGLYA